MLIRSAQHVARWSTCFLAFTAGFFPSGRAEAAGFRVPWASESQDLLHQEGFSFRSVFIAPQYARQADTPLPLSWWETGSDSPVAIAIGYAEGTRQLDGSRTAAYYWHSDPGNAADNFGSFSFQHFRPREKAVVEQQNTTDDKRWAAARRALPELADRRQMLRLRQFHDRLVAQAKVKNLELSPLELLNGLDLANQSELAALDDWGYIDRLVQAKQRYTDPDEQILQARTWAYWHPTRNDWDAPGLGNTQPSITADQHRRATAVKQVLAQVEAQPTLLDQLDPTAVAVGSPQATQSNWALSLFEDLSKSSNQGDLQASQAGFASQPLKLVTDSPLQELIRETRQLRLRPEQQADIALAEALPVDEAQQDKIAQAILAVETDVTFLLAEQPYSERSALDGVPNPDAESTAESEPTMVLNPPGWQSGLLMASLQSGSAGKLQLPATVVPEITVPEAANPEAANPEAVIPETANPEVAIPETANPATANPETVEAQALVAQSSTAQPSDEQASVVQVSSIQASAAQMSVAQSSAVQSSAAQSSAVQSPAAQASAAQASAAQASITAQTSVTETLTAETTKSPSGEPLANESRVMATPSPAVTVVPQQSAIRQSLAEPIANPPQSLPPQPLSPQPLSSQSPTESIALARPDATASAHSGQPAAAIPGSVSVAAVAEKSSEAIATQIAAEAKPPSLSVDVKAVAQPATEAMMAAAAGLLTEHLSITEAENRRVAEAKAAEAKAAEAKAAEALRENAGTAATESTAPETEPEAEQTIEPPNIQSPQIKLDLQGSQLPEMLGWAMTAPKLEADHVADQIIRFEGLVK